MQKKILLDEFHVTALIPRGLAGAECTAIRQILDSARFQRQLRHAIRGVIRQYPALATVSITVNR